MKRIVSLFLALILALSLCSFASAEEATGMDAWTPFESNVELQIPVYDRGVAGIPSVQENYWTQWIQENFGDKYNITVKFIPITRTAVENDYGMLASRQALPTILMEYDYPKVSRWVNEGYMVPVDLDAFKAIAPTYYQQMVDNDLLQYSTINDDTYFVEAWRPYAATTVNFVTFYRMDWLRQVGYDHIPVGREEYLDAMQKIMDAGIAEHPGGGATFSAQGGFQVYGTREFPMDEREWAMYGDFQIPAMGWEPAKEVVRRANEDYHLGITNPEYYVTDATTAEANFYSGKTYAYGAYIAPDMQLLNNFYAQNPDAELVAYTKMEDESVKLDMANEPIVRVDASYGMLIGFSSQATDDQIKAAMMYLEWMVQPENLFTLQWGIEGEHFNYEDGIPTMVANYEGDKPWGFNNNKDYWCAVIESRELSTFEEKMAINSPKGLPKDFTQEFLDMYDLNCARYEKGYCVEDCKFGISIEAENEYRGTLQALFTEYYDKLVMCDPDEFDALYDQYTQEYMDAGYREVIEERAAAYDAGQSTHLPDNQKK